MHSVDCSDTDSDDDLVPYAMDDDPDASQPVAPRYLRTLMQGEGWGGRLMNFDIVHFRSPLDQRTTEGGSGSEKCRIPHSLSTF